MHHPTHSILIETSNQNLSPEAWKKFLINLDFSPKTSFVFLNQDLDSFKIKDVRLLQENLSYGHSAETPSCFVILGAEKITLPAQNALLKILEEPPQNANLVLVASHSHELLSTIVSRCLIKKQTEATNQQGKATEQLLSLTEDLEKFFTNTQTKNYSELIELAEKLKDREEAIIILKTLITNLSQWPTIPHQTLKNVLTALDSLQKNGNVRLVLEDCFFTVKKQVEKHSRDSF